MLRQKDIVMQLKLLAAAFAAASVSLIPATATKAQNIYCDSYGGCSGTTSTGSSVNTYTDSYGGTTGTIGGQSVNLYTDSYGVTSGTVGGQSVSCITSYGVTTCN